LHNALTTVAAVHTAAVAYRTSGMSLALSCRNYESNNHWVHWSV